MNMSRVDDGRKTGKFTYSHKGWKVSVLNAEVTQVAKGDESRFFDTEEAALEWIEDSQ